MSSKETSHPNIEEWTVIGANRVCGIVYNRQGKADGGTIVTSPVLEIQTREDNSVVAVTQTGSLYRLGQPSKVGAQAAAELLRTMVRESWARETEPAQLGPKEVTVHYPRIERIELDATSFQPLNFN